MLHCQAILWSELYAGLAIPGYLMASANFRAHHMLCSREEPNAISTTH